jgi:hypothetical protein
MTEQTRAAVRDGTDVLLQRLREYSLILYDNPSRHTVSEAEEWRTDAVVALVEAAQVIRAYDQAGGNEWWEAHAKLYAALVPFVGEQP